MDLRPAALCCAKRARMTTSALFSAAWRFTSGTTTVLLTVSVLFKTRIQFIRTTILGQAQIIVCGRVG